MTLAVYVFTSLLLAWSLIRRPQMLCVILAGAFVLDMLVAQEARGEALRSILMGVDGLAVIGAWAIWRAYDSSRAALVAVIGMVKVAFGIAAAASDLAWVLWASGNNALFISQVLVSGGFANGFMAWLGRSPDGTGTRNRGVLGYLERLP
ncbi:MAG: hypothetical protein ACKO1K_03750 [Burkholderiales bacterium]